MPTEGFAGTLKADRAQRNPRYAFGFGWGSDLNGLGAQPGPTVSAPIRYPFKSYDGGVTFSRERWGQRVFDFNKDGLANYGMYADWLRQLQSVGGRPMMNDMFRGAEAYLDAWERAYGVAAASCRPARERFTKGGLGRALRLGSSTRATLYRAGQRSGHVRRPVERARAPVDARCVGWPRPLRVRSPRRPRELRGGCDRRGAEERRAAAVRPARSPVVATAPRRAAASCRRGRGRRTAAARCRRRPSSPSPRPRRSP